MTGLSLVTTRTRRTCRQHEILSKKSGARCAGRVRRGRYPAAPELRPSLSARACRALRVRRAALAFPAVPSRPEDPVDPDLRLGPATVAIARAELDTTQRMDGDTNWMGLAALSVFHQRPSWRIKNKGDTAQTQKHTDTATARTCTRITRTFTTRTRTTSTRRAHKHTPTSACAQTRTRTQGEWLRMRSNTSAPARPGSPGGPGLPGSPCSPGGPWGPDCPSSPTSPGCPR